MNISIWWIIIMCMFSSGGVFNNDDSVKICMDIPNYPVIVELDIDESYYYSRIVKHRKIDKQIKILSITPRFEPNYWFGDSMTLVYSAVEVEVEVDGIREKLLHRPYEMPKTINGIRIYIEGIRDWSNHAEYGELSLEKMVRLSICAEEESWGPKTIRFPIENYRWRSNTYNNTWSSLVPYNLLYYHRGEDYGAIPDKLNVISPIEGKIVASPLPDGDGKSNGIIVKNRDNVSFRMSHMNIETVSKEYQFGTEVSAGSVLAKTGMTWAGKKSQVLDPHCHINMDYKELRISAFPYLVEAYLRDYSDEVIAIAGGYQFVVPGQKVSLDGSRSIGRFGEEIESYKWILHDGREISNKKIEVEYTDPGLYSEELLVITKNGAKSRDFLQVRVWDPNEGKSLAYGWSYHHPVRGAKVDDPILFWCKWRNIKGPIIIDFGDGESSPMGQEIYHSYSSPGTYIVSLSSTGHNDEPIIQKMEIKIDP